MLSSNVCSGLNRCQIGYLNLGTLLRHFTFQSVGKGSPVKQLVASTFYKTRAFIKFLVGNNPYTEFKPRLSNYSATIRNVSDTSASSVLGRVVVGKQFPIRRFNAFFENSRFKGLNRRHLTGTGVTLGLVGVCIKNENGYPNLLPDSQSKMFNWNDFFQFIKTQTFELKNIQEDVNEVEALQFKDCISKGCNGVVYKAQIKNSKTDTCEDVAVKMLFNYDIQSNSTMIINGCIKECVPFNGKFGHVDVRRKKLPPHPNIVKIMAVFVDYFQPLKDSSQLYPQALPLRYGGYGRNKTLFIVEKLYDTTLKEYLHSHKPSAECSLAMLAQCMDAIDFLNANSISHRDLKPDNILVDLSEGEECPWMVITDFGLCSTSLVVPFQTDEVCRGGNRALMAPEIVNAKPSSSAILDYTKSDLWALGTIAYEIFGAKNPFYKASRTSTKLNSATYEECQLPAIPIKSRLLRALVRQILSKDPDKRPTTAFAAGLCQLLFHMGAKGVNQLVRIPDREIRNHLIEDWFKMFTYKSVYEMMNEGAQKTFTNKMRLILLTRMQADTAKRLIDEVNIYLSV